MSRAKTRKDILAELAEREKRERLEPKRKILDYIFGCKKIYCPVLESINNVFALRDVIPYQEPVTVSDLVSGVREHREHSKDITDIANIYHQIFLAKSERSGSSFSLSQQRTDPLNDSGMHIVTDPGFGYDD